MLKPNKKSLSPCDSEAVPVPYNVNKQKYAGITTVYTRLKWQTGIVLILLNIVYAAIEFSDAAYYWGLIPTLFPIVIISYLYFLWRVTISPEGVRYTALFKERFLRWSQVKMVGVVGNRAPVTQIFVHDEKAKYPELLTDGDYQEMILFKFRPKIMHHILCCWDGDIVNLQNVRAWRKYLINNGTTSGQSNDITELM